MTKPYPFNEVELLALESHLFDDQVPDALDLIGLHGLVTALCIEPGQLPPDNQLFELVLGADAPTSDCSEALADALPKLQAHIHAQLTQEENVALPDEAYEDDDALLSWCCAFMEGVYTQETRWFDARREEAVASLLLPIMAHSGLFQEGEFASILPNQDLMTDLAQQIPETVLDLYLLCQGEPLK